MKYLTPLLIPLLFLSSCTIDWNDEKDAKITEQEKQVTELKSKNNDELFKKKQECYKKWKESKIEEPFFAGTDNPKFDVFYSPVKSSCLFRFDAWFRSSNERVFGIIDILSSSKLYGFNVDKDWRILGSYNLTGSTNELKCQFNEKLSMLKGEDEQYFGAVNCVQ